MGVGHIYRTSCFIVDYIMSNVFDTIRYRLILYFVRSMYTYVILYYHIVLYIM